MAYRVLIPNVIVPSGVDILKERGIEVDVIPNITPSILREVIGGYDGLIVRSNIRVTGDIIAAADRLRVIGRPSVGVDNIDLEAATAKGIVVMNVPGSNSIAVAEHVIALMLGLARYIPQAQRSLRRGKWERDRFRGIELQGKTLGIIGLGRIGSEVAKRAQALGMRVIACDPYQQPTKFTELDVESTGFNDLLKEADFITLHVPLTDETRALMGAKALKLCKNGVRIINCSRGGVVDEQALYQAIMDKKVAGAALDVFQKEPPRHHPLLSLKEVILTPHIAGATVEAQQRGAEQIARQVANYLLDGKIENSVNRGGQGAIRHKK